MINAKDIDYYSNIDSAIDYLQNCINNNIELKLSDTDIKSLKQDWKNFSKIDNFDKPVYNFNELTERLSRVNFAIEIKEPKWLPIEDELGDEYKDCVKEAMFNAEAIKKSVTKFPESPANLMLVFGQGGIGKTFNVGEAFTHNPDYHGIWEGQYFGNKDAKYYVEHWGSSKINKQNLYELAWRCRNPGDILVLDDCDSTLHGGDMNNMMKHLTDSKEHRWENSPNKERSEGVPEKFDFQGKIIQLTNKKVDRNDTDFQALLTRAKRVTLVTNNMQKVAFATHLMLNKKQYKTDAVFKRRANFCAKLFWLNRQFFANDYFSLRAAMQPMDLLNDCDDDLKAFENALKIQDYIVFDVDDKESHKFN